MWNSPFLLNQSQVLGSFFRCLRVFGELAGFWRSAMFLNGMREFFVRWIVCEFGVIR